VNESLVEEAALAWLSDLGFAVGQPNPQVDGWVWVTGEPVSFTAWGPGSPDQTQVDEDAALYGSIYEEYGRLY